MLVHWILLTLIALATSDETYTVFSFSRKINTCDPLDRPLEEATSKIIWAYNDNDPNPETGAVPKHSDKGSQSVRFFSQGDLPPLGSDAVPVDVTVGGKTLVTFDNPAHPSGSNYWCSTHKIVNPILSTKQHLIRFDPIIDPRYAKNVHHMIMYLCKTFTDEEMQISQSCYDGNMPTTIRSCLNGEMLASWAVGGESFDFPPQAGMPFGPTDSISVLIESHFENPDLLPIYDDSGFRMWFTPNLRQYDAGIAMWGHDVDSDFVIPKGQAAYTYEAWVPADCTNLFPPEGLQILAVNLHTHVIGTAVRLQQFRDGVELQPILEEPYYDFNFQDYTQFVDRSVKVLPGDSVRLTCTYNSLYRNYDTPMGLSTQEEMCTAGVIFYPKWDPVTAFYADYSPAPKGKTVYFGNEANYRMTNLTIPPASSMVPYQPPPCEYSGPDPATLIPRLRTTRINPADYQRSTFLDPDNKIKLYWSIDRQNLLFHGAIEARTPGWVGFGISAFGMEGADVTIGWVDDNNEVFFADRFATRKAEPPIDPLQDFYDVSGGQVTETESSSPLLTRTQLYIVGAITGALIVLFVGGGCYCYQRRKNAPFAKLVDDDTDTSIPM